MKNVKNGLKFSENCDITSFIVHKNKEDVKWKTDLNRNSV